MLPMTMAPNFTVVLRGYDREEVDALLARLAAGEQVSPAELDPRRFTTVLRGYDRAQVAAVLARYASAG